MAAAELWQGPVQVMLAKAQDTIPGPDAMPGGTVWELKFDGYRAVLRVTNRGAELWSRNGSDLSRIFPELIEAAEADLPAGSIADGEAVVWVDGRLSFDHLQQRMVAGAAGVARLARQHPASYVAFDLLAAAGQDLRPLPWRDRRAALEAIGSWQPPLQLSPYTTDPQMAAEWFRDYPGATGVEGLVAKGAGSPYRPGSRGWIKIKSRETMDGVIGAVIGSLDHPEALVVGRYTTTGVLTILGRTGPITSVQAKAVAAAITAPASGHPWPAEISSGHFGGGRVALTQGRTRDRRRSQRRPGHQRQPAAAHPPLRPAPNRPNPNRSRRSDRLTGGAGPAMIASPLPSRFAGRAPGGPTFS